MNGNTAQQVATNRERAEKLVLDTYSDDPSVIGAANVYATLAAADAIDRLTAVLDRMQFPTLDFHKSGGGRFDPQFRIEPVKA